MGKYAVEYRINKPMGGVQLTGGALKDAFENNVNFLKKFDMDRMLYWYRVHKGKPAPGVPTRATRAISKITSRARLPANS